MAAKGVRLAMNELNLLYPLHEQRQRLLSAMDGLCAAHGIAYVVVGATARDIMLHHIHDFPIGRASHDIDFAVAVQNWASFENLRAGAISQKGFRAGVAAQRLLYQSSMDADVIPIDLVPFGGVANQGQIAWPPDMNIIMSVLGFDETLQSALMVRIKEDLVIPVASIPGLVITKLLAWLERGIGNPKDATDFRTFLLAYEQAGNTDRIYDDGELLGRYDFDLQLAGAVLMARDVKAIVSAETAVQLSVIFGSVQARERLLTHMLRGWMTNEGEGIKLEAMLNAFASELE